MTAFRGVLAYEFRMQIRKRSLWIVLAALIGVELVTAGPNFTGHLPVGTPPSEVMGGWALTFNLLPPLAVGTLLADRMVRDQRLGVVDVLDGLPVATGTRL
jgi:hypothetical protein